MSRIRIAGFFAFCLLFAASRTRRIPSKSPGQSQSKPVQNRNQKSLHPISKSLPGRNRQSPRNRNGKKIPSLRKNRNLLTSSRMRKGNRHMLTPRARARTFPILSSRPVSAARIPTK